MMRKLRVSCQSRPNPLDEHRRLDDIAAGADVFCRSRFANNEKARRVDP
jgi:hypothetical protein